MCPLSLGFSGAYVCFNEFNERFNPSVNPSVNSSALGSYPIAAGHRGRVCDLGWDGCAGMGVGDRGSAVRDGGDGGD